jgi:hypothetical protein
MSRKSKFILVALVALVFNLKAQFTKTDGKTEACKKLDLQFAIGQDNNAFYICKSDVKTGEVFAQRFNKKTLIKEWEIILNKTTQKSLEFSGAGNILTYLKGNQLYLYLPQVDKKNDKVLLLLYVVGIDGKIIGDAKEVYSIANKYNNHNLYDYSLSADSSKMIFSFVFSFDNHGVTMSFSRAAAFDLKNAKQFDKPIPNTYQGSSIKIGHYVINNDGKVAYSFTYAIDVKAPTILDEDAGYSSGANYSNFWAKHDWGIAIAICNPAASDAKVSIPNFGEGKKSVADIGLTFINNKLLVSTVVTDFKRNKDRNSGIYVEQIDATKGTVDFETFQYFSEAWKDRNIDNNTNGFSRETGRYQYKFNLVEGGSYIITAFGAFYNAETNGSKAADGMIVKVNAQGKIEWTKALPMNLFKYGNYVNYMYYNKKMYYFFNDPAENEKDIDVNNVEASKKTKSPALPHAVVGDDWNTICISYDLNGKAQRTIIQNNKDFGFNPLDKTILLEKNKILLYFQNDTKGNYSTLTIQ